MKLNDILKRTNFAAELSEEQESLFAGYYSFLAGENGKYNLTSVTGEEDVYVKHFADSLAAARLLPHGARIIDAGAGAGFPSVPLLIARPDLSAVLVDSVGKKAGFLRELTERLGLGDRAEAVHARIEDLAKPGGAYRERFGAAVARAVAPLPVLLEYCLPLVRTGGFFLAYKTDGSELSGAENALRELRAGRVEVIDCSFGGMRRVLIKVEKAEAAPAQYPRGGNKPRLKPL